MSRGITQLENLGLIERVGDPDDGRARLLRLTTVGAERFGAMRAQRQTEFRAILDRWNPTDLADLGRLLPAQRASPSARRLTRRPTVRDVGT